MKLQLQSSVSLFIKIYITMNDLFKKCYCFSDDSHWENYSDLRLKLQSSGFHIVENLLANLQNFIKIKGNQMLS